MAIEIKLIAVSVLACLAIGGLVLAVLSVIPATRSGARSLWPTYATEIAIVVVGVAPFLLGRPALMAFGVLACARIGYEIGHVVSKWPQTTHEGQTGLRDMGLITSKLLAGIFALIALAGFGFEQPLLLAAILLSIGLILLTWSSLRPNSGTHLQWIGEIAIYPAAPLAAFAATIASPGTAGLVLLALLLVETFDSYALLGGKLFGRHKAFPILSPNKTIEGLVIGALALALSTVLIGSLVFDISITRTFGAAIVIAICTIAGDLAASRIKRKAGVKDYPIILPRQGGLLDIADGWIIAGPVFVFLAALSTGWAS